MTRVIAEITKDMPERTYRYVLRCDCGWTDNWPFEGIALIEARWHVKKTGHARVVIEDTEA